MAKPKVAILIREPLRRRILSEDDLAKLEEVAQVELNPHERDMTEDEVAAMLRTADGCMSSWGTPPVDVQDRRLGAGAEDMGARRGLGQVDGSR